MTRFRFAASLPLVASLLLLAGCGTGQYPFALDPKPVGAAPVLTVSPTSLTFTAVSGQTSPAQSIVLGNVGNATLNFSSISVNSSAFTLTNGCGSTLAPGANCTLSVTFSATTNTSVSSLGGSITIVDNSGNVANAAQTVSLSATGTGVPMPIASLTPATVDFPDTPTGVPSASQTLTLKNIGTAPLVFSSITSTGTSFKLLQDNCTTLGQLAPGSSCTYLYEFLPTASGAQTGSFVVTDNDKNVTGSTQAVTLTGNGTDPAPIISLSPSSLDFGSIALNQASATQTVTVGNTGNATLNFASIVLNSHEDYILVNNCATTLAPSATCTLVVSFTPSNPGAIPSSITLTDNDQNNTGATQAINLTGIGAAPAAPIAMLSPLTLSFPDTPSGTTSASQTVTLKNIGNATLNISGISYTGAAFGESTTCVGTILPIGNTCTFTVAFSPTSSTAFTGSLTITDDSGGAPGSTQTATFSGKGLAGTGALTLTPAPFTFPDTFTGSTSAAVPFTLKNNGAAVAGLTIAFTGGTSSSAFAQTNNCGASLAGGASCTINATFTPAVEGTYQSLLTANYTGATQPVTSLVTGTGIASCTTGFTPNSLTFSATHIGTTSQPLTTTFTNCTSSPITIGNFIPSGTDPTEFTQADNCPPTLASGASCMVNVFFTPVDPIAYTATFQALDSAPNSPQILNISGTGTNSTITYNLYEFGFAHPNGTSPSDANLPVIYGLVNNAKISVDMVMYAMSDTTFTNDLVAACNRGVAVRAILDQNSEKSRDTPTYNALNALTAAHPGCSAVWANKAFSVTHQKTLLIDGTTISLMSLNLESQDYDSTRDWAMIYNDPADYSAIENTFNADFAAGTPASGVAGVSDKTSYTPSAGSGDLIWSPQTSLPAMLSIINNSTTTLVVSNEELGSSVTSTIVAAMVNACKRGVVASILIEDDEKTAAYLSNFATLKAAGCGIHSYDGTASTAPYIHAKAVVADYGLPTQNAYMGSINYSSASMTQNRELGMFISDQAAVTQIYNSIMADFNDPRAVIH